jgi:hypothetical protein
MNKIFNTASVLATGLCLMVLAGCCGKRCKDHSCSDHSHHADTTVLRSERDLSTGRESGPHVPEMEEVEVTWDEEPSDK